MTDPAAFPVPSLATLRAGQEDGPITTSTEIAPGIALHADPAAGAGGRWVSPAGRLLEIAVSAPPDGKWTALHLRLEAPDLAACDWLGLICRSAAPGEVMVRPCLRWCGPASIGVFGIHNMYRLKEMHMFETCSSSLNV